MSTEDRLKRHTGTTIVLGHQEAVVPRTSWEGPFTQASAGSRRLERAVSHWRRDRAGTSVQLQPQPQLTQVPPRAPRAPEVGFSSPQRRYQPRTASVLGQLGEGQQSW